MSGALLWHILRDGNAFVRKGLNGAIFSAEPGNLYSKHSYKYSGLANAKNVDITVDKTNNVSVGYGSVKNANKPKKLSTSKYVVKSNARRALKAIGKQVGSYRPDLKKSAIARMAAVQKSLRVKKATK